jgi:uncharacterized protein
MNAIHWFEIPARDIERAQRFYEDLLGTTLRRERMGPDKALAVFPYQEPGAGGCLMSAAGLQPSGEGTLAYLGVQGALDVVLARLGRVGGRLLTPKVTLPDGMGVFAHIEDSEGNRVGLHAMS